MERSLYDIVVRDSDDKITDMQSGMTRTESVEFMRSLFRGMDYDEVIVQVNKRIPA
jgi:hypothetical protein